MLGMDPTVYSAKTLHVAAKNHLEPHVLKHYFNQAWPPFEMREIEHSLCEFHKYEKARLGIGQPKQKLKGTRVPYVIRLEPREANEAENLDQAPKIQVHEAD